MADALQNLVLFDVDGTLTEPRKRVDRQMTAFLAELRKAVPIGVVGGSDLVKIREQLGDESECPWACRGGANCSKRRRRRLRKRCGAARPRVVPRGLPARPPARPPTRRPRAALTHCHAVLGKFDYVFAENGLVGFKGDEQISNTSIQSHLGDENLARVINTALGFMSTLGNPVKRGTFIEFRTGMLNISPIGRACSQEERDDFEKADAVAGWRKEMVAHMRETCCDELGLTLSIGGQISFDVFPNGWDKTYCLQYVTDAFKDIHFFGDKTYKGGNDHEIYESERTIGHSVKSWQETREQCTELFLKK